MESKVLKLQNELQKVINDFCNKELLPKEYIQVNIVNGEILGSDGKVYLLPTVKVILGVNDV